MSDTPPLLHKAGPDHPRHFGQQRAAPGYVKSCEELFLIAVNGVRADIHLVGDLLAAQTTIKSENFGNNPLPDYHEKMILAAHIIFSAYGFWLPNDPRGSWSEFVAAWELLRFGKATKVQTHRSVAHVWHDRELRRAAKGALKYTPVLFTGV